jgi:multicomponent Na+:H+ antiporter subunit D
VPPLLSQQLLVAPILFPLAGALVAAVVQGRVGAWVAVIVSGVVAAIDGVVLYAALDHGPLVYQVGGWQPPQGIVLVADRFSASLALTASIVGLASALHTFLAGAEAARRRLFHPFFLLLLMALSGVFLTGDLFNLYVFMELVILSSIVLVAMAGRPVTVEATFKYAVISAIGSTMLLTSIALVYAATGTLTLADIARQVQQGPEMPLWPVTAALMLAAFLLKGAIFPFHFWQPDAHSAAPASVSAMLSGVLVKVGFYGVVRMSTLLFPGTPAMAILAPLGGVSALFGAVAALANPDLKRLLAYSTISNMGLILLAFGWGGPAGITAAVVHTVNHALVKGSLFLAGGYIAEQLDEHDMHRIGGLAQMTPGGAAVFGMGALALAGLPPFGVFVGKFALFQAGFSAQDTLLLVVAAVASTLGIAYSLRAFLLVLWGKTPPWVVSRWRDQMAGGRGFVAPLLLAAVSLLLGIWPGPLTALGSAIAEELLNPAAYVAVVLEHTP